MLQKTRADAENEIAILKRRLAENSELLRSTSDKKDELISQQKNTMSLNSAMLQNQRRSSELHVEQLQTKLT